MSDSARYHATKAASAMSACELLAAIDSIDERLKRQTPTGMDGNARSRHKARTRRQVYQEELTRR